ncbi:MAG TPA: ankyrin repeat domain-containing protein [Aliidongia sp.]|uniref:ankyrin repeat domain-containing protein n=1 Tax=Aliidongia sp. TaxID=1914230 RepID=UPI002DDDB1F5|nr:ankyrin repeat domain-containing protein [Aliidongia sp.]HEV2674471.1 ankyrin repeat domain-containing protein [Aliidongia sp.]
MSQRPLSRLALSASVLLALAAGPARADFGLDLTGGYLNVTKAVQAGDLESLRQQVVRGDELNHQDDMDRTALTWAAIAENEAMVKLLVQGGARTTIRDRDNRVPLHWAVQKDAPEVVKALLDGGAAIDVTDQRGTTPLMMAAANGNVSVVRLLISRHAKIDLRDYTGRSALDFATDRRQAQVVQALKQAGAS